MKRLVVTGFILGLVSLQAILQAQPVFRPEKNNQLKASGNQSSTPATKPKAVFSFLAGTAFQGGAIPKKTFDDLVMKGIRTKDSAGLDYKVYSFNFSYSERQLYEDSVGNLMWLNDFFTEYCLGDTVNTTVKESLIKMNRTKPGDTAYFDAIKVLLPDGSVTGAKSMKFYLTK